MDRMTEFLKTNFITDEDCRAIVNEILKEEGKTASVCSYGVAPARNAVGYLGDYYDLDIQYQRENEIEIQNKKLFVKTLPFSKPTCLRYVDLFNITKKESDIYSRLLNEMSKLSTTVWYGKCYYVKRDVLVMENLENLGYQPILDAKIYPSKPQLFAILRSLAAMHACSLGFEKKNNVKIGDLLKDALQEVNFKTDILWHSAGLKGILSVLRTHPLFAMGNIQDFIKTHLPPLIERAYEKGNPSTKYCNVFCHRDIMPTNIFLPKSDLDKNGAIFVDFQMSRYSPPAIDVLMAVTMHSKPDEGASGRIEYYKYYYEQLSNELAKMGLNVNDFMTYKNFEESLDDLAIFAFLQNAISATAYAIPTEYLRDLQKNRLEDFYRFMNVDRTEVILDLISTYSAYREYVVAQIELMFRHIIHYYSSH